MVAVVLEAIYFAGVNGRIKAFNWSRVMHKLELIGNADVPQGSGGLPAGNLIMIHAHRLTLHPSAFVSGDAVGKREGHLAVTIDNQSSELHFAKLTDADKPQDVALGDQLLYVGGYEDVLPIRLRLVESDADLRELLRGVGSVADLLTLVAPATGGGPVIAALNAYHSLTSLVSSGLKDQDEFLLLARLTQLGDGDVLPIVAKRPDGTRVFELELAITDLGRPRKRRDKLEVSMDQVELTLPDRLAEPVRRGRRRQPAYERFNFEAASGRNRQALSVRAAPLSGLPEVVSWHRLDLFTVQHRRTGTQRYFIPFAWSMALTKDSFRIDDLLPLVGDLSRLVESLAADPGGVRQVSKTGMTLLAQFAATTDDAVLLSAFAGGLLLLPLGLRAENFERPGVIAMPALAEDLWVADVSREAKAGNKSAGVSFRLTVDKRA
jgi:hypothetical protein